jgi:hypothetical protein
MSFLSGIVNFGKSALGFLGGNSIGSSLVKTALLGYAVNKMSKSVLKENDTKGSGSTSNIDKGVRLQVKPNAEAKIPVLYGDAFFGGNISDAAMTNANKTMWYCLTLAEKTGTALSGGATTYTFQDVYWNQQRIVFQADGITADYAVDSNGTIDRSISGLVKVYLYAGSSSNGQIPTGYSGTVPNSDTVFPNWTSSTHPMTNLVFALVRVDYNREKNVTGIADMLFQVESSMKKPGDVLYDYLTSTVYGAGIPTVEIDTTSVSALNTYSAESVSYNDEGTGAQTLPDRYQINGLVDTDETVLRNAEQICSSTATWLSYDTHEGKWGVVINKAGTTVASFSDTNILGNISVGGTGLQDLYNSVKVEFPHRDLRDSADFIKIEIPANLRNANEPDNTLNITYDNINEPVQAEQLGFIELKQSRVDLVIQFETDFSYINLKAGDVIDVTNDRYSFTSKLFRIVTITERQDNDGALMMEVTALEYDADVYSVSNITRFTRSSANGIISIGAIGTPSTPQVTKFERASRPRIEIEVNTPTGVVEGLEYWVSFDYTETDDTLRSYTLVGTKKPLGGGVFTSSTQVVFEYANLNAQNFYVKVRGFNTTAVGPYSNVSGLVEFIPEQVPDAITPDTSILDSTGGLATALGIVSLLNNIDGLFGSSPNQSGGLFSKIFDVFNDETGIDLVGDAAAGNLVVAANIAVQEEGANVVSQVSAINFVGDDLTVTANGTVVTVTHNDTHGGGGGDGGDGGGTPPTPALVVSTTLPPDRTTYQAGTSVTLPNQATITGSYFISWSYNSGNIFGAISLGTGNAKLYKSDGTLVQTLAAIACSVSGNTLELPFSNRDLKTDYYILLDAGLVTYCGINSVAIDSPLSWNFNTPNVSKPAYAMSGTGATTNFSITASVDTCGTTLTVTGTGITAMATGSSITIDGGANLGTPTISGVVASIPISGTATSTTYNITLPDGAFTGGDSCFSGATSGANTVSFTIGVNMLLVDYHTNSGVFEPTALDTNVNAQSNIRLEFNQNVTLGTGNINIYTISGSLHQQIPVTANFASDNTSELIWAIGDSVYINPTVDMIKGTPYYILADAGSVVGTCSTPWGETSSSAIAWTVDPGPSIASVDPIGSTGVYGNTNSVNETGLALNIDRTVTVGTGNYVIYDSNNTVVATIPSTDPRITYGA